MRAKKVLLSLDDIAKDAKDKSFVDLRLEFREDEDAEEFEFYITKSVDSAQPEKYNLGIERYVKRHVIGDVPFEHDAHQRFLGMGDRLFPEDGFPGIERNEQFIQLFEFITGEKNPEYTPKSEDLVKIYRKTATAISQLKEAGCHVTFAGSEEKAEQLATLAEYLKQ